MKALIIGGSSGIGSALACQLVHKGYDIMITGRRLNKLQEVQELYPNHIYIKQHDVRDYNASEEMFDESISILKTIDLIIYSSGVGEPNYDLEWSKEVPTLETNIMGAVKIYGLAYQLFKKQGFGHLVGISSIAGIRGNRHVPAYFASKAFQINYLESLWLKGKRSKSAIYVTDVRPGFVDTDMAIGETFWMASPEKAAKQIIHAIEKKKKRVYITKRWFLIALVLKIIPSSLLLKM
ncbi:MAG: SDR family NAD(P)-dependent oxidoreductase [Flavobacteriaceae bacterium]|nr:SDR family NAD(P)-dependent oxidoreductase [Flavobacteriaceae bacterium]